MGSCHKNLCNKTETKGFIYYHKFFKEINIIVTQLLYCFMSNLRSWETERNHSTKCLALIPAKVIAKA